MTSSLCSRLAVALTLGLLACARPVTHLFTVSTGAPSRAEPVALKDGVLVGNEAGRLLRLDSHGQTVWKVELGREVAVAPAVSGDTVIVGTQGGTLLSLDLATGEERWRITGQPAPLASLVADAECVYLVEPGVRVRALAVKTGAVRWVRALAPLAAANGSTHLLPTPTLAWDLVVVADATGVIALSSKDGSVRWRLPLSGVLGTSTGTMTGTSICLSCLYVSTRGGNVLEFMSSDGRVNWTQTLSAELTSPPSYAHGQMWVGTAEPGLIAVSEPAPPVTLVTTLLPPKPARPSRRALPGPLVAPVEQAGPWLVVTTRSREGWVLGIDPETTAPVFTLRLDTAVVARPVVRGDQLFVLGRDGRVFSWRLNPAEESGR